MPRKKLQEEYLEELEAKGICIEPLETYINSRTKILHKCKKGHEWSVRPGDILSGRGCPTCYGKKKRTHEQYLKELFEKEINFEPLEPYVTHNTKILHRCEKGHEWSVRPGDILSGIGCPTCSGKKKRTHEEYLEELFEKEIDCEPLEPYVTARTKILHRCIEGHKWYVQPDNILSGGGCPECYRMRAWKTHEEYLEELFEKEIDCEPLETYINRSTKILHRCIEGHKWFVSPSSILRGKGCPECAKSGFNTEKPAILYYLKVDDYYKIGITNRTVNERFPGPKDREKITVLFEKYYEKGQDAYEQEQAILKEFADFRVHIPGLLEAHGNTELFIEDVLQLDKKGPQKGLSE